MVPSMVIIWHIHEFVEQTDRETISTVKCKQNHFKDQEQDLRHQDQDQDQDHTSRQRPPCDETKHRTVDKNCTYGKQKTKLLCHLPLSNDVTWLRPQDNNPADSQTKLSQRAMHSDAKWHCDLCPLRRCQRILTKIGNSVNAGDS